EVTGVEATIDVPASVAAGSELQVIWTGPDNPCDYISIDPAGSPAAVYGDYGYTREGSPLVLVAPDDPGTYEVRYHMSGSKTVIGLASIEVTATSATVSGPSSAAGGSTFEVAWTGPANRGDYLTIVSAGADPRAYESYAYTRDGSPVTLKAPLEVGAHELRYVTGAQRRILASAPIEVTPGSVPGTLRVVGASAAQPASSRGAVEVILDASGSMLQRLGSTRRIEIAKSSLDQLIREAIPAGTPFALRVFGHREADSCRTDLEIPLAPLSVAPVSGTIASIEAKNRARTPIAASLAKVREDLAGASGPLTVVLLTDGEETCDGDPQAAVQALRASGIDVRVNIVGFAIDDLELEETFRAWARLGGGSYLAAGDADQLVDAMDRSLRETFDVFDGDALVTSGVVGGEAVALLPGTYRLELRSTGAALGSVEIEAGREQRVHVP
ncbi:MAG: VWA domain-containing protein, partial [Acidobacteriota bacterium]